YRRPDRGRPRLPRRQRHHPPQARRRRPGRRPHAGRGGRRGREHPRPPGGASAWRQPRRRGLHARAGGGRLRARTRPRRGARDGRRGARRRVRPRAAGRARRRRRTARRGRRRARGGPGAGGPGRRAGDRRRPGGPADGRRAAREHHDRRHVGRAGAERRAARRRRRSAAGERVRPRPRLQPAGHPAAGGRARARSHRPRRAVDAGVAGSRVAAAVDRSGAARRRDARGRGRLRGTAVGVADGVTLAPVRLAVIADVHGNLPALEAVLDDVSRQHVDRLVVNGDLANRGPDTVAVFERTAAALPGDATLGNHDALMLMWFARRGDGSEPWFDDPFWGTVGWSAVRLEAAGFIDAIERLPMTLTVHEEGTPKLLISHGSPRHYREGYGAELSAETISEITEAHPADVLVGSHTHRPFLTSWGRFTVINTGAVGAPFNGDPRAHYLILELAGGEWVPEFRRVPYDVGAALERFES